MFKLDWDINAASFALSESDAYVDAIIIYRILLRSGYINLKLNTVEEFLKSNGRIAYPSRYKANKISDINYDITCDQIPHKIIPHSIPASQDSDIKCHTTCNHQQDQKQLQTFSTYNVQNGLVNAYSGRNTWNSYPAYPNHYIQNSPQVQDINSKATNKKDHFFNILSHNQMSNQNEQMIQPNFGTQVANNDYQRGIPLSPAQYHSQATQPKTSLNCNSYQFAQAGSVVPNNNFYPCNNLPAYPICSANHQNNPNSHKTNNINQGFHQLYYNNDSNVQTNITNNTGLFSFGKRWDTKADNFVMRAFQASILEMWTRLKQDGYSIEIDEVMASLTYQRLISNNKKDDISELSSLGNV